MTKPKSFEEFYCNKTGEIYNVEVVVEYASKNDGDYTPYKESMRCPECCCAELTLVSKTSRARAHLRKRQSSNHNNDCSYIYEYASKKTIQNYVNELNYNQIQDRLDSIIRMLFKTKVQNSNVKINSTTSNNKREVNPMLIHEMKKGIKELKSLRRKNLSSWIDEFDGTDLYLFYGNVKLEVVEKEKVNDGGDSYKYYLLNLWTLNKNGEWKYRTKIYRGGNKDIIDNNKVYQIAMVGNLNFNWKRWQIDLINQSAIRFVDI